MTELAHTSSGASTLQRSVETRLPTQHGTFQMIGYDGGGLAHVALVMGDLESSAGPPPLVRVHSECLTGDALGSYRCDCGEQLQAALAAIAAEGRGALIYARGHEGRGIGLLAKLQAYALQDTGVDTVDANLRLGYPADARDYSEVAGILHDLGATRITLLTANPDKGERLSEHGIDIAARRRPAVADRPENAFYLDTKRRRMRHDAVSALPDAWSMLLAGQVPPMSALSSVAERELVERYGPLAEATGPLTIAQMGQSMDGFIASRTGDGARLTGEVDHTHLHRLRALVDAVLVGASTVIADDPRLTVRMTTGAHPVRVVIDPQARVPRSAHLLTEGEAPTIWMVGDTVPELPEEAEPLPAHVSVARLPVSEGAFSPAAVVALLHARGLVRVLVEGGGRLVSAFLAAGALDRLFVTVAPVLIGDGVPGLRFDGSPRLAEALRAPNRRWSLGADVCTEFLLTSS